MKVRLLKFVIEMKTIGVLGMQGCDRNSKATRKYKLGRNRETEKDGNIMNNYLFSFVWLLNIKPSKVNGRA